MNDKYQALILAAGDSKRLRSLTEDKPKSFCSPASLDSTSDVFVSAILSIAHLFLEG